MCLNSTMNEKEVHSTLDNGCIYNGSEKVLENSNTAVVERQILASNELEENISKLKISPNVFSEQFSQEENEYDSNVMTGSYGEISFDQEVIKDDASSENRDSQSSKDTEEEKLPSTETEEQGATICASSEQKRPNSLTLSKNAETFEECQIKHSDTLESNETWKQVHKSQQTSDSQATSIEVSPSLSSEEYAIYSPAHHRNGSDTSGLSDLQGTITVDGDMVSFVIEDLQEKIKMSSPVSRWTDSPSFPGSRSSTPSLYRQALQPHIPSVDATVLTDLENHARKVATCLDTMLENLSGTLQSISSLTVDYMETYESAVCKTCDAVDVNIKTMYQLIAKCEELSNSMRPIYRISGDIKEIKKMLDHFESIVEH